MFKLVSWNIAHREEPWRALSQCDADVALLQEAAAPPVGLFRSEQINPGSWHTAGAGLHRNWRTAIANLSERAVLEWIDACPCHEAHQGELGVSRLGTLAAARVLLPNQEPIIVVSVYGAWERPLTATKSQWIYADASVHRLLSDLAVFIGHQKRHRLIIAGDFNILHGYGEDGSSYWKERYDSVFTRLAAMGLTFAGPQSPNGRQADPWPNELPAGSLNVPTFYSNRQTPNSATRQLDFVFVSNSIAERVSVRALNSVEQWGPSDHCQVEITITTSERPEDNS